MLVNAFPVVGRDLGSSEFATANHLGGDVMNVVRHASQLRVEGLTFAALACTVLLSDTCRAETVVARHRLGNNGVIGVARNRLDPALVAAMRSDAEGIAEHGQS